MITPARPHLLRRMNAVCSIATLSFLSSCAEFTNFNHERYLNPPRNTAEGIFIDAKQRAVITASTVDDTYTYAWDDKAKRYKTAIVTQQHHLRTCAEPSPDALTTIASSGGFNATVQDKVNAAAAFSLAESGGSIGLRTQSIQLMRDAMYRVCEGYLSGALSEGAYESMNRRLQSSMVAILAIEQLTGAVRARQIAISTGASTGASDKLADAAEKKATALAAWRQAQKEEDTATATLNDLTQKAADAKKESDATPDDMAKKTALTDANKKVADQKKVVDDKDQAAKDKQAIYESLDRVVAQLSAIATNANGVVTIEPEDMSHSLSDAAVKSVSDAVTTIVNNTLGLQFSHELCATVIVGQAYKRVDENNPAVRACTDYLGESVRYADVTNTNAGLLAEYIEGQIRLNRDVKWALHFSVVNTTASDDLVTLVVQGYSIVTRTYHFYAGNELPPRPSRAAGADFA